MRLQLANGGLTCFSVGGVRLFGSGWIQQSNEDDARYRVATRNRSGLPRLLRHRVGGIQTMKLLILLFAMLAYNYPDYRS